MVVVLLAYWGYAALTPLLSPSFDSPDLIVGTISLLAGFNMADETDKHSGIPPARAERYYWKFANPETIPEAVGLPIDLVNRVLYPPRKRPRSTPVVRLEKQTL
jgi:phosphatidylinositol glycan class P protein